MAWIPPGFGHGVLALEEGTTVLYKATDFYAPQAEGAVRFDDPAIGVQWPDVGTSFQLSGKDKEAPLLADSVGFD